MQPDPTATPNDAVDPKALLPHRSPFLFVSAIGEIESGVRGTGSWVVNGNEDFFRGHFPDDPLVPGVLLAEALAQISGVVAFQGADYRFGARLARIDIKVLAPVRPPAHIVLKSRRIGTMGTLHQFDVSAEVNGQMVCSGMIVLAEESRGQA